MAQSELSSPNWIQSNYFSAKDKREVVKEIGLRLTNFGFHYRTNEIEGRLWFYVVDKDKHILQICMLKLMYLFNKFVLLIVYLFILLIALFFTIREFIIQ